VNIELRWVNRVVMVPDPDLAYRDRLEPVMKRKEVRVLQHRFHYIKSMVNGVVVDSGWSDWTDVPVEVEK